MARVPKIREARKAKARLFDQLDPEIRNLMHMRWTRGEVEIPGAEPYSGDRPYTDEEIRRQRARVRRAEMRLHRSADRIDRSCNPALREQRPDTQAGATGRTKRAAQRVSRFDASSTGDGGDEDAGGEPPGDRDRLERFLLRAIELEGQTLAAGGDPGFARVWRRSLEGRLACL